jgi:diguanylate cyclase (GGDEF)-like protein
MAELSTGARPGFAWLFEMPPHSERTLRMEALIARLRLLVLCVNAAALALFLDTSNMHTDAAWWIICAVILYAIPVVGLQPYRRWRVFQASLFTTIADTLVIALFVAATGAAASPFFLLYYLSVAAVAMRFELRQAIACCLLYAFTYAVVFFATWQGSANEVGELMLRVAYMIFIAVGVGHLAREEGSRSRQVDEIERLNAENSRLLTRSERAARADRLTGLLNRAHFEKEAQRELRRARSAGGYVSVLFCDMDGLKRVNDELGHDVGDRVLKQTGSMLKRCLRAAEFIGRYGGDEFVVILPNLTRESALERGDQLIESIAVVNDILPEHLHIGLSVGVATCPFDATDYTTLVKLADQAMYLAKREGGGRVRTANDLRLFWEELPHSA